MTLEDKNTQEKAWTLRQKEVHYTPLSAVQGKACASCRWFNPYGEWRDDTNIASCHLVDSWPDTILATGLCDRHEVIPQPEIIQQDPLPVVIVELDELDETEKAVEKVLQKPGIIRRFWDTLKGARQTHSVNAQFKSIGNGYWVGWYSNNLEDREAEIIAAEAHDKFISRVKAGIVPMPELWFWHIPGTLHGKAIWLDRIDHMVVSVGRFDDTPFGKLMQEHYETTNAVYAMSHGFTADKSRHFENGVWYDINTFEESPLAPEAAANVWTLFSEVKSMASPEALAALKGILVKALGPEAGEAEHQKILGTTEAMNKQVSALGVRYKDFTDPAKANQPSDNQAAMEGLSKNLAPYLVDLTKDLGEMATFQTAQAAEIDALKKGHEADVELITELKGQIETLQAQMNLTPRRASQDQGTKLPDQVADKLKQRNEEYDPFWGDMDVPK